MTENYTIIKKLAKIQQELKAPKNQRNNFGNYNYRSCEDILEAVKPLLGDMALTIADEMVQLGDRFYIKATCTLYWEQSQISNSAYAREAADKKGMDDAQITGAASSYARKYALNGLFAIDDTKDADTEDNTGTKAGIAKRGTGFASLPEAKKTVVSKTAPVTCESCHAPAGKPHATGCINS